MPFLVTVPPGVVAFALYKSKHKTFSIPLNMENVCIHNIFGLCHKIPFKAQKSMGNNKLFPFLLQKELTYLFVNIGDVTLNNLLVCNVTPDVFGELLQVLKKLMP